MTELHAHTVTSPAFVQTNTGGLDIVSIRADGTDAIMALRGEMDLANADLLTAVLRNQLSTGHRFVRLDLSELRFLDCAGLRALVEAHNEFLAARGTLTLIGVGPRIVRMLAITRLDEALFLADGQREDRSLAWRSHLSAVPNP